MNKIGIMQGRLIPPINNQIQCFPSENWSQEFPKAQEAKLDCIEWIYDFSTAKINPLTTDDGINQIKLLEEKHEIKILSLCADYFMEQPLIRATESELSKRLELLFWLMKQAQTLGIKRIVLPFVDASAINNDEEIKDIILSLNKILSSAENTQIEIHLETSLTPEKFAYLLDKIPHPLLKVNYDSGNSASLGYHPDEEFNAYGKRVGSVHIKDRKLGGKTVALGTGDTDFSALFKNLSAINYSGDIILQVARDISGNEVEWAIKNRQFVLDNLRLMG